MAPPSSPEDLAAADGSAAGLVGTPIVLGIAGATILGCCVLLVGWWARRRTLRRRDDSMMTRSWNSMTCNQGTLSMTGRSPRCWDDEEDDLRL